MKNEEWRVKSEEWRMTSKKGYDSRQWPGRIEASRSKGRRKRNRTVKTAALHRCGLRLCCAIGKQQRQWSRIEGWKGEWRRKRNRTEQRKREKRGEEKGWPVLSPMALGQCKKRGRRHEDSYSKTQSWERNVRHWVACWDYFGELMNEWLNEWICRWCSEEERIWRCEDMKMWQIERKWKWKCNEYKHTDAEWRMGRKRWQIKV